MTLISALEDLHQTTLKAVSGFLRRLEYLSGLRDKEGDYEHWGLNRVYGDLASKRALAQAHRAMLSKVLTTPLKDLVDDAEESSKLAGVQATTYVERLSHTTPNLLPTEPGAGSARHLNSVLHALASLLRSRKPGANPPA